MWHSRTNRVKTQLWMSSLMHQTSTAETRASVCLRGPNPSYHAVYFIYSLVTCSHLSHSSSGRSCQLPCAPSSLCRWYRGLFLFRGLLFSSVASVSCSPTGQVHMPLCQTVLSSWTAESSGAKVLTFSSQAFKGVWLPVMLSYKM